MASLVSVPSLLKNCAHKQREQIDCNRREQNAAIGPQQDAGSDRETTSKPRGRLRPYRSTGFLAEACKSAEGKIQGERSEENLQRFREHCSGVIGEEGTQSSEHESVFCRALRKEAERDIRNQYTCAQIEQDLYQQDGAEITPSEDGEKRGKKCGISREAR